MQSTIEICNVALSTYLGAQAITALAEGSVEAQQCSLHYDRVRRSLLVRRPWTFAGRREALVQMALNDRAEVWAFRYARPAHMLALRWVNDPYAAGAAMQRAVSPDSPREVTGDSVYSSTPGAVIDYTSDLTDPTLFPPAFADALAASLAAAIAMPITMDASKARSANEMAAVLLNQAMVQDFNARPAQEQTHYPAQLQVRGIGTMPSSAGFGGGIAAPPAPPTDGTPFDFITIYEQAKQ